MLVVIVYLLLAVCMNKTALVIAANKTIPSGKTIIIDAGHGGEDGGATSCTGVLESEINLEIAVRLEDMLNLLGYRTIMVREDDSAIHTEGATIAQRKVSDLKNRVQLVNNASDALLISIHQNYFTDERYYGAQVFYADTDGSRRLAENVQETFRRTINQDSKRMVKSAENIYLMERIQCDGVLVECGFLSNYREAQLLESDNYQKKVCAVIASAVCIYLQDTSLLT